MTDVPAPGAAETVARCRDAGIRTLMVTGDQRYTAEAVARELGLLQGDGRFVEGGEVDAATDEALRELAGGAAGFSRVSPEAKLRIVAACQARGEVVAMLGDGVNDAAALRKADIGVVMGQRGTDLAKEAADIILTDDRFATIAAAIEEGRVVFDNIRKFVLFLFSCNLAEILVVVGGAAAGYATPLLPLQILWLNLLTDTAPALALALEPGEADLMRRPPRSPRSGIMSGTDLLAVLGYALLISLSSLGAFAWALATGRGTVTATTLAFTTLALGQLFHLGNARRAGPVLTPARVLANPAAIAAVLLMAGLQVLAVQWEPLAALLGVRPATGIEWLVAGGLGLVPGVVGQAVKLARGA
jgi:Ca2+-transporting ATPase